MRIRDEELGVQLEVRVADWRAIEGPLHGPGREIERDDLLIGAWRVRAGGNDRRGQEQRGSKGAHAQVLARSRRPI